MPVSSTATTTGAGFTRSQADWKPATPRRRASIALALLPLTGCSHHCWPNNGSVGGTCRRRSRAFGSTQSTSGRCSSWSRKATASWRDSGRSKSSSCWSRPTGRKRGSRRPELPASPASPSTRCQRADSPAARAAASSRSRGFVVRGFVSSCACACFRRTISPRAGASPCPTGCACSNGAHSHCAAMSIRIEGSGRSMGVWVAREPRLSALRRLGRRGRPAAHVQECRDRQPQQAHPQQRRGPATATATAPPPAIAAAPTSMLRCTLKRCPASSVTRRFTVTVPSPVASSSASGPVVLPLKPATPVGSPSRLQS